MTLYHNQTSYPKLLHGVCGHEGRLLLYPIRSSDKKFLRFIWEGELYEFTCLPNGLPCAPRIFTKILKPPLSTLHKQGHTAVAHLYVLQG